MFVIAVATIIILLTFLSMFYKNIPLYAVIILFPILPTYFAFNLGDNLPLLTAYRIIVIFFFVHEVLVIKTTGIREVFWQLRTLKLNKYLFFYLFAAVLSTILARTGDSIKELFSILLENIMLFYFLVKRLSDKEIFNKTINILIITAFVIGILGLVEGLFGFNIFSLIDLKVRDNIVGSGMYERMGTNRVESSFGHPIGFGLYLMLILPLVLYKANQARSFAVITFFILIINLLLTISRGPIIAFLLVFCMYLLVSNLKLKLITIYIIGTFSITAALYCTNVTNKLTNLMKSVPLTVMSLVDNKYSVQNFGANHDPFDYRLLIIDLAIKKMKNNIYFGLGMGYFRTHYFLNAKYGEMSSIDNNYLLNFLELGIVGAISIILLDIKFLCLCFGRQKNWMQGNSLGFYLFLALFGYYLSLTTVASLNSGRLLWIFYALITVQAVQKSDFPDQNANIQTIIEDGGSIA